MPSFIFPPVSKSANNFLLFSGNDVLNFLNSVFPRRWIGRGEWVSWAQRIPDLSFLDFFLWGHIKNLLYATQYENINSLKQAITEACQNVNQAMLQKTIETYISRFIVSYAQSGQHIVMINLPAWFTIKSRIWLFL